jgi:hypothetical protein
MAKTGTITFVNSLAGYAQNSTGETFAFAVICNNQTRQNNPNRVIDSVILTLATNGAEGEDKENSNVNKENSNVNTENSLIQNSSTENKVSK